MNAEWLLHWWNLIFLLPFGLALLYLGLYTLSGITFGDADIDHGFDADHDLSADHDMGADAGHDLDADQDMDAGHDAAPAAGHASGPLAPLSWLGVGRVPLSILLMVLLLTWGVVGFVANAAMEKRGASAAFLSVPISAAVSLLMTLARGDFDWPLSPALRDDRPPAAQICSGQWARRSSPSTASSGW